MVVVVVAVGGLFVRLFAYSGDPRLRLYLWKDLWKDLWKSLRKSLWTTDLRTPSCVLYWMGRPCAKSVYLDGPAMCKNKKRTGQGWGPMKRRRRHFVLSLPLLWHVNDMTICICSVDRIYAFVSCFYSCCLLPLPLFLRAGEYIGRDKRVVVLSVNWV